MAEPELTCEAICDGLLALKKSYEDSYTDFDISYAAGVYGEGQHVMRVSVRNLLSDAYVKLSTMNILCNVYKKCAEPVEPFTEPQPHPFYVGIDYMCGKCMHPLTKGIYNYCPHCGKEIKWK